MRTLLAIATLALITPTAPRAQHATRAGELVVEPPTLIALGFEWYIDGDANRNATVTVSYREKGATEWRSFLPLLRIGGEEAGTPELGYVTPHLFAGSIFDLEPDTAYECRLELRDPDGVDGQAIRELTLRTRAEPRAYEGGAVRHVYPRDWDGPREEPAYDGLYHAYYGYPRFADWNLTTDPVQPGDRILIHAGTYKADPFDYRDYHGVTFHGGYFLTQKGTPERPIVIRAAGDGEVVFDGNGAYKLFDVKAADHHHFEGLTIRNAGIAFLAGERDAMGASGLVIRHNRIEDVGIGVQAQYQGSKNFYIADNVILGREDTTKLVARHVLPDGSGQQRFASYYGIKVYGQGHVIAHNYVAYFFDGIDISTHGTPEPEHDRKSVAIDIYNNDIHLMNDNFIEADGGTYNIRILRNRCANSAQAGFTNQPVMGGPAYWVRNVSYNTPKKPAVKSWGMRPAGVLVYHNTFTTYNARDHQSASNIHFRNNLFLPPSDDAGSPVLALKTHTSYSSLDHNGYRFTPREVPPIQWHAPRDGDTLDFALAHEKRVFDDLEAFQRATGQEMHGRRVDYDVFIDVREPAFRAFNEAFLTAGLDAYPIVSFDGTDFRIRPGSAAHDAGMLLPGINDDYEGVAPDLGAYEVGQRIPWYGPRPAP